MSEMVEKVAKAIHPEHRLGCTHNWAECPEQGMFREMARAAIEAIQWQPIKTAPKDGTDILIANFSGTVIIQNDYWTEYNEPEDGKIHGCWCDWHHDAPFQPTHWKPIDPPLKEQSDDA